MDDAAADVMAPVPVTGTVELAGQILDKGLRTSPNAAAFGSWTTYVLAGAEAPQIILPFDDARSRALIIVSGTGPVFVGAEGQVKASPRLGGQLPASLVPFEIRNQQALWLVPDGSHPATVTILIERWET
jgi:hypothetical protein